MATSIIDPQAPHHIDVETCARQPLWRTCADRGRRWRIRAEVKRQAQERDQARRAAAAQGWAQQQAERQAFEIRRQERRAMVACLLLVAALALAVSQIARSW